MTYRGALEAGTALATGVLMALSAAPAEAQQFQCGRKGGELVFAQEAKVNSLDQHASSTISTRNIAMNMYESLMTRDENMSPMLELAQSVEESKDRKTYTFKLRQGVKFHNGKTMTSADVLASFDRYKKVGILRGSMLDIVEKWTAPDPGTFVIDLKEPQPTFIENLSSFSVPVVIIPAENAGAAALQLPTVGTGPFQLVEFIADSHVKIKRYDGYVPDTRYKDIDGFGGYKQACLDSVNFRIVVEPGARVAGLETGELHGAEDVPATAQKRLKDNRNIVVKPLQNFWIQIATVNLSQAPTDNIKVRQAIQAALDMDEIMEAATDGAYRLNIGFQYPGQAFYNERAKDTYNQKNSAKAKQLLAEGGYKGEEVVLLTNRDYTNMYNAAQVMAEQMKAIGIKARLEVMDWPASVNKQQNSSEGWNFFFTGWGTNTALGGLEPLRFYAPPFNAYKPKGNVGDPDFVKAWDAMVAGATVDQRKAEFANLQEIVLRKVLAVPFGALTKIQVVRSNVENFRPFRIPRMSNVWLKS
jgi:peptide/nickel transport system substrate-binding protein